jgi:16S rRNA (guanine966-N2)-methyltransferase
MFSFIKQTAEKLQIENFTLILSYLFRFIDQCHEKFDFIFAGPPYALETIDELPKLIFKNQLLNQGGWFVLEHTPRNNYQKFPHYRSERNYGTTVFSVFVNSNPTE